MQILWGLLGFAAWWFQAAPAPAPLPAFKEMSHDSQVFGGVRTYRVLLPPGYEKSQKRYPVVYWLHGYERTNEVAEQEQARYVAGHDLIIVSAGPVETVGSYPLYFPELVDRIDKTFRTIADRDHRGLTGFGSGGFMAFWLAGKCPDLAGSASSFNGTPEAPVGPRDLDVDYNLEDQFNNYDGVATRLVTGAPDNAYFYHRRMNNLWMYTRVGHETENFDAEHGFEAISKTLDFHMHAFAHPLPRRPSFNHADVYPNFMVWDWQVLSDRKQPGYTVLENVSSQGFRSTVRQWIPGGAPIPEAKLSIISAKLYPPGSTHPVTYIRLRDGNVRRVSQKADAQGRLSFDLDGEAYEVGISGGPLLVASSYEIDGDAWATAGKPVKLRVRFWNKGSEPAPATNIQWESSNPLVKFEFPTTKVFPLKPGESAVVPVSFTVSDQSRSIVKIFAVETGPAEAPARRGGARSAAPPAAGRRMPLDVQLFPPAESTRDFHIADGRTLKVYQHATSITDVTFGEGNQDGHAAPGESFSVLIPDGDALRAAELFTNDACVDVSPRGEDPWNDYDHGGASVRYSVPVVRPDCQPGHIVHMLARIWIPQTPMPDAKYLAIEFPVWYRPGEEPKPK